jgi:hypothetical protein
MESKQLMWERGRTHAREVLSHDSLPCKPSHNWSPSVFVSTVMMCPVIDNPARAKFALLSVFFHSKNISAAEINSELCAV